MKTIKLVASILVCELVGIVGGIITSSSIPTWYRSLNKPNFSPPNWLFGPVWTTLYLMMGVSIFLIIEKGVKKNKNKEAFDYFVIQLLLNFLWSLVFFGFHQPYLAYVNIIALVVAIIVTILKFYKISKPAAYLLLPYLAWVSFASFLNLAIVFLNK